MGARFKRITDSTKYKNGIINILGLSEGRTAPVLAVIAKESERPVFIITSSFKKAKGLYEDLSFLASEKDICLIPEDEKIFLNYDAKSRGFLEKRLNGVIKVSEGKPCIVIASVSAALRKIMPKQNFVQHIISFTAGDSVSVEDLKKSFAGLGYDKVPAVEIKGQYSIRGDIADIYPYNQEKPIRIEFFDDIVDSIRYFDIETQRSLEPMDEISIYPALELLYSEETGTTAISRIRNAYEKQEKLVTGPSAEKLKQRKNRLIDNIEWNTNNQSLSNYVNYFYRETATLPEYMPDQGILIVEDYVRVIDRIKLYEKEMQEEFSVLLERGEACPEDFEFSTRMTAFNRVITSEKYLSYLINAFAVNLKEVSEVKESISVRTKALPSYAGKMEMFLSDIRGYCKNRFEVSIVCADEERKNNLRNFLERNDTHGVNISVGSLSAGSEYTDEKLVIISDNDIFPQIKKKKRQTSGKKSKPIKSFVDIKRGDYVVHENHGIGKFLEIHQLEIDGIKRDYLKIQYAGEDTLYVPVDQMDCVQKYIGGEDTTVKVNHLSGGEWTKAKQKVKASIEKMAGEIIELSAQRRLIEGYAFSKDTLWQKEFEDSFQFAETEDQLRCSEEIKLDMEKTTPMERLLCGDVGYGKTEVAARAVFKCVADGKQAAILVPTTILASQHYNTFVERFEAFPFKVEMLSRFRSNKQKKEIIKLVEKGQIDILIGTHRMLSKDVKFKDLGLLVIDEEQRFGVRHKTKIKMLRKNVDVLTLSATPIPRTLHLSLIGARDMSIIEEPPEERYPVQTYVLEQDDEIIKNAIESEMDRGGQAFVVYNRVKDIDRIAERLRNIIPDAEIAVGHGKMDESQLENIIIDFIEQRIDVLVCTTIIETGIDMPNANTIIVLDADKFGLSQLYQLRGRVGRSNRLAYAYLMYQKEKVLTEISEKRLAAIRDFTELGAGFKISMRDLELRGAGNILGTEQSGHMVTVGYELYCKLLEETISVLKGERSPEELPEISIEMDIDSYIPDYYVEEEAVRIEIYQKIAMVEKEEDKVDLLDELIDRFGDVPRPVENLITIAQIKACANEIGIEKINEKKGLAVLSFYNQNKINPEKIANMVKLFGSRAVLNGGRKPFIKYQIKDLKKKAEEVFGLVVSLK